MIGFQCVIEAEHHYFRSMAGELDLMEESAIDADEVLACMHSEKGLSLVFCMPSLNSNFFQFQGQSPLRYHLNLYLSPPQNSKMLQYFLK